MKELIDKIRKEILRICPEHIQNTQTIYTTLDEIESLETSYDLIFPEEIKEFWLKCDFEINFDSTALYFNLDKNLIENQVPSFFSWMPFHYLIDSWHQFSGRELSSDFHINNPYYTFPNRGFTEKIIKQDFFFDKKWFPVFENGYGDYVCVDLNPGINGLYGQLIYVLYSGDICPGSAGPYYSGYKSLYDLLENYLEKLIKNEFVIEDGCLYQIGKFS